VFELITAVTATVVSVFTAMISVQYKLLKRQGKLIEEFMNAERITGEHQIERCSAYHDDKSAELTKRIAEDEKEIKAIRSNYLERFAALHREVNTAKEQIIGEIHKLELRAALGYASKEELEEIKQELHLIKAGEFRHVTNPTTYTRRIP